jgi:hypothetical protein
VPGPPGPNVIVAAGHVRRDGDTSTPPYFRFGGLDVQPLPGPIYMIRFDAFTGDPDTPYVVKGTPIRGVDEPVRIFEVLDRDAIAEAGSDPSQGLHVRLVTASGEPIEGAFMVEISDFSGLV